MRVWGGTRWLLATVRSVVCADKCRFFSTQGSIIITLAQAGRAKFSHRFPHKHLWLLAADLWAAFARHKRDISATQARHKRDISATDAPQSSIRSHDFGAPLASPFCKARGGVAAGWRREVHFSPKQQRAEETPPRTSCRARYTVKYNVMSKQKIAHLFI